MVFAATVVVLIVVVVEPSKYFLRLSRTSYGARFDEKSGRWRDPYGGPRRFLVAIA